MRVTVLIDNAAAEGLAGEWGLSFFIEFNGKRYLLDAGGSEKYIENANALQIDLSQVDYAVLSHAHYDHSIGMEAFLNLNSKSPLFVSPKAKENCYSGPKIIKRYIGLPKGFLTKYAKRICTPEGIAQIDDDVYLVPHATPGLKAVAKRSHLYQLRGLRYIPDDFSHEQSLVFRTRQGLVVFNSCSHSGADIIAQEVRAAFHDEQIAAYFGGLHLFRLSDNEVEAIAERIKQAGIERIYTGHCTGDRAFQIISEISGLTIKQFHSGMTISL